MLCTEKEGGGSGREKLRACCLICLGETVSSDARQRVRAVRYYNLNETDVRVLRLGYIFCSVPSNRRRED